MAEPVRAPPAHLSARAARPQRLLQPGEEGAAVRLFPGRTRRTPTTRRAPRSSPACRTTSSRTRRTHALLDGIHPRFNEPTNPDVHAFHEAFADIVALFQHFTYPGVLRDQIARTRGDLRQREPARPAGAAVRPSDRPRRRRCATRSARKDRATASGSRARPIRARSTRRPSRTPAAPSWWRRSSAPSCLIYRDAHRRPLAHRHAGHRQAAGGRDPPRPGQPARRGGRALRRRACCRCASARSTTARRWTSPSATTCAASSPPTSTSIRRTSTATASLFVESFREWGIYPRGIRSMWIDALAWPSGAEVDRGADATADGRRRAEHHVAAQSDLEGAARGDQADIVAGCSMRSSPRRRPRSSRLARPRPAAANGISTPTATRSGTTWSANSAAPVALAGPRQGAEIRRAFGLVRDDRTGEPQQTVYRNDVGRCRRVEVHAVRTALRRDARGADRDRPGDRDHAAARAATSTRRAGEGGHAAAPTARARTATSSSAPAARS